MGFALFLCRAAMGQLDLLHFSLMAFSPATPMHSPPVTHHCTIHVRLALTGFCGLAHNLNASGCCCCYWYCCAANLFPFIFSIIIIILFVSSVQLMMCWGFIAYSIFFFVQIHFLLHFPLNG
jgi:hypothetical protein